jgi:Txe/YoeB family toxin of Txe-Axe toxin-antitoxin module
LLTTLPEDYKNIDKNPHYTIEEMLVNTIRRKDNFAIIGFYEQLNSKIKDLINTSGNSEGKNSIF